MRNSYGLSVSIDEKSDVTIGKYSGILNFKYAQPMEANQ
jgi:hypothetical protein